jgi:glycosyltransferase involved in cell wall biosynthesis
VSGIVDLITIVLPTYDRRHVLERTIASYLALARSHRLLVIDDGSHDGTAPWLRAQGVEVVRLPRRGGLPAARNLGLRLAGSAWVLFGEDDVLMPPQHGLALLAAAARLERLGPLGAIAGRLFAGSDWQLPVRLPPDAGGALLDGRMMTADFAAALPHARPLPSLHACALVRREAALSIGGYDQRYRDSAFREESDFYARMWRSGRACWLVADSFAVHVRHRLGGGCRGDARLAAKLANRWSYLANHRRFARRHQALWRRWCPAAGAGASTLRWALRIAAQPWRARRGAADGRA